MILNALPLFAFSKSFFAPCAKLWSSYSLSHNLDHRWFDLLFGMIMKGPNPLGLNPAPLTIAVKPPSPSRHWHHHWALCAAVKLCSQRSHLVYSKCVLRKGRGNGSTVRTQFCISVYVPGLGGYKSGLFSIHRLSLLRCSVSFIWLLCSKARRRLCRL